MSIVTRHKRLTPAVVSMPPKAETRNEEAPESCRQEREALDKLREKQRLVHLQEEATEEQAWLDEVAVLRWGRT